ncbi:MAG TPA: sensor histidine kinase [bacterium]|nr:sensor histidine kinase [bacterium]
MDRPSFEPEQLFSPFDRALGAWHKRLFGLNRQFTVGVSILAYAVGVLSLGHALGISTNYFVILPIIAVSMAYGLLAGTIAGILGLPANLALYWILGHPEFSPASKLIAELSGLLVGSTLGYLSDYYRKLDTERQLRKEIEIELRKAIRDRETLFREVHHRVKNNLNLVKSIINLQVRRSGDPAFHEAATALIGRIMTISFVHERLYRTSELSAIALDEYLSDLVKAIISTVTRTANIPALALDMDPCAVTMDVAVPVGLMVNELISNALRHGGQTIYQPRIEVSLKRDDRRLRLTVRDNGPGFQALAEGFSLPGDVMSAKHSDSLGLTLIESMATDLGGAGLFSRRNGWTEYRFDFLV